MAEQEYNSIQRINIIKELLDNLTEAKGRAKCGYITVIDDFLTHIQDDILILEEKVRDAERKEKNDQNGIE